MSPTNSFQYLTSSVPQFPQSIKPVYIFACIGAWIVWKLIYQLVLWPRFLSPLRNVPGPPLGGIVKGQFAKILREEAGIPQREWLKQYGPTIRVVGPIGIERLIFTRPATLHRILVSEWTEYPRPSFLREVLGFFAGHGLGTVTGDEHRQMRKTLSPAFSIPNLLAQADMFYGPINSLVQILKEDIDDEAHPKGKGKVIPIYDWLSKVALDILCDTAFGYKADCLTNPHSKLAEAYESITNTQDGPNMARFIALVSIPRFRRIMNSDWVRRNQTWLLKPKFMEPLRNIYTSMNYVKQVCSDMLKQKMQESTNTTTETKRDIMSLLIKARREELKNEKSDVPAMSDQQMTDHVMTFLSAGHETVASGIAWTLWLLANDQNVQDQLRREVEPLFEQYPLQPDYHDLRILPYLDNVIMESLRLLPPAPMTFRQAKETAYIEGIKVPKGTLIYLSVRAVNTMQDVWGDDAESFNPTRWQNLPENYVPSFSFLSFIAGPHGCIGKTLALLEMKAVVATLIYNFSFEPSHEGQVAKPTAAVTMKPADSMPLRMKTIHRN